MAFCKHISLNLYIGFRRQEPGFGWRALTIWFAECHWVKMVICNPLRIPRFQEIGRSVVHLFSISSMVHGGLSRLWFRDWSSCAGRRGTQDFHCSGICSLCTLILLPYKKKSTSYTMWIRIWLFPNLQYLDG